MLDNINPDHVGECSLLLEMMNPGLLPSLPGTLSRVTPAGSLWPNNFCWNNVVTWGHPFFFLTDVCDHVRINLSGVRKWLRISYLLFSSRCWCSRAGRVQVYEPTCAAGISWETVYIWIIFLSRAFLLLPRVQEDVFRSIFSRNKFQIFIKIKLHPFSRDESVKTF